MTLRHMETANVTISDFPHPESGKVEGNSANPAEIKHRVDEILTKVDKLEERVNEVEQFYSTACIKQPKNSKGSSIVKEKDIGKRTPSCKKQQKKAARREAAAAKRMQELMRQFGTILRQITQHKWAWPFMQPVDVEGLGLQDYYEVIDSPMDFSTIKNQMEAKYGAGYKNVREIDADVRLVFENAMKYNDEKSDVYEMAETLLAKYEEKWQQLLPKVIEEEKRREEEEAEAELNMQLSQEVARAKVARDLDNELYEVDKHLEELRDMLVQKCRLRKTQAGRSLEPVLVNQGSNESMILLQGFYGNNNVSSLIFMEHQCFLWYEGG